MPETKRPLKVFLCHAHSDALAVRTLYNRLIKDGVDVWLDKEKLLPGQDWEHEIRKAVREVDIVVVCLSKQFNQAGFRQREVRLALDTAMEQPDGEIFIIPARLEECETLESLRKWHWVNLFEADGYQKLLLALRARADRIGATLRLSRGGQSTASHQKSRESQARKEPSVRTRGSGNVTSVEGQEVQSLEKVEGKTTEKHSRMKKKTKNNGISDLLLPVDKRITEKYFPYLLIICMALSAIVGGLLWNLLNKLLGWTFNSGGTGNEPHGFQAFIWGVVSFFPVVFFAGLACYRYFLSNSQLLRKFAVVTVLYSIFAGVGAVVFYDFGFRSYIESQELGYGAQELIIVLIWSFVLSVSVSMPLILLTQTFKPLLNVRYISLQIPFSMLLTFFAIMVSLFSSRPESEVAQLRGLIAAVALRIALFAGLGLAISQNPHNPENQLVAANKTRKGADL